MLRRLAAVFAPCSVAIALTFAIASGCSTPCTTEQECFDDQFCSEEGVCTRECNVDTDCDGSRRCTRRGKCEISLTPVVNIISPAAGAEVGETFDIEVDVTFRADQATVTLTRDDAEVGGICGPFAPQEVTLTGDIDQETTQRVIFRDVRPYQRFFSVRAVAVANQLTSTAARDFAGITAFDFGGAQFQLPEEEILRANALSTFVGATFNPAAGVVSTWVEPDFGLPSPRVLLAQNATSIEDVRVPLARGRQTVWLETERQGVVSRCGRALVVAPDADATGLEVALTFDSEQDAELDLWIFAERDGYEPEVCTVESPRNLCRAGTATVPFQTHGEETLLLDLDSGVYGIAVAPAIVSEPVSARVRLSTNGVHLGWLGPRRVFAEDGMVWLAGRIYVLNGQVTIEPLEDMVVGLPSGSVSEW